MYIVKKTFPNGDIGFKTYDGWVLVCTGTALELDEVMRFTKGEALDHNLLDKGEQWVWYGSYKRTEG